VDINAAGGSDEGLDFDKIDDLPNYATSPYYDEAERTALELADEMTREPVEVSDELYARLRRSYDEEQLVELAGTIALENFRSRLNRVFKVESQGFYCRVPDHNAAG
jgi:alkylhydroperoxidase family enzyme